MFGINPQLSQYRKCCRGTLVIFYKGKTLVLPESGSRKTSHYPSVKCSCGTLDTTLGELLTGRYGSHLRIV